MSLIAIVALKNRNRTLSSRTKNVISQSDVHLAMLEEIKNNGALILKLRGHMLESKSQQEVRIELTYEKLRSVQSTLKWMCQRSEIFNAVGREDLLKAVKNLAARVDKRVKDCNYVNYYTLTHIYAYLTLSEYKVLEAASKFLHKAERQRKTADKNLGK